VSESGEVLPTPQALHDVLGDAATRHVLATHRATIRSALAAAAVDGSVLLAPETFRSTLLSLQLGFNPKQVDDLLQCLVYLGRLGEARGAMPPAVGPDGITELVRFSLLFQHDDASTAPAAPEPPGLVRQSDSAVALAPPAPAGNQQRRQNKWADAERSGAHREKVGRSFRLPSVEVLMPKGSEDTIMAMLDSDDDGDDAHGNGAAVALGGSEEEEDDDEDDDDEEDEFEQLSAELKVTRARALANNRANNAQRFRMPSVEELILDAVGSRDGSGDAGGVDSSASGKPARRRETMPGRCDLATRDTIWERANAGISFLLFVIRWISSGLGDQVTSFPLGCSDSDESLESNRDNAAAGYVNVSLMLLLATVAVAAGRTYTYTHSDCTDG